jgi:hypothetical protein
MSMLSAFLKHLNMGTLAFGLFVALALLNPVRGKEPQITGSAHVRDERPESGIAGDNTSLLTQRKFKVTNSPIKISGIKSREISKHR